MRIGIAYFNNDKKIESYARSLGKGLEKQTNAVIDLIDIKSNSDKKLTGYNYLIFGCGKSSAFGVKVEDSFKHYLKNCGHITGKHTFVYTCKGLRSQKFLSGLMKVIESEGVLLKNSSIITTDVEAEVIGSKLHIK